MVHYAGIEELHPAGTHKGSRALEMTDSRRLSRTTSGGSGHSRHVPVQHANIAKSVSASVPPSVPPGVPPSAGPSPYDMRAPGALLTPLTNASGAAPVTFGGRPEFELDKADSEALGAMMAKITALLYVARKLSRKIDTGVAGMLDIIQAAMTAVNRTEYGSELYARAKRHSKSVSARLLKILFPLTRTVPGLVDTINAAIASGDDLHFATYYILPLIESSFVDNRAEAQALWDATVSRPGEPTSAQLVDALEQAIGVLRASGTLPPYVERAERFDRFERAESYEAPYVHRLPYDPTYDDPQDEDDDFTIPAVYGGRHRRHSRQSRSVASQKHALCAATGCAAVSLVAALAASVSSASIDLLRI